MSDELAGIRFAGKQAAGFQGTPLRKEMPA